MLLAVLCVIAAGGTVYYLIDDMDVSSKIAEIDALEYETIASDKGEQYEADGMTLAANKTESLSDTTYHTELGFSVVSYSDKWTGDKLIEVYEELLNNTHGEEMEYISEVIINPGGSELDDENWIVAGTQSSEEKTFYFYLDLPALIPRSLEYAISPTVSVIQLYNMDAYDTIAEAAPTIAHEYGHHYTIYYFLQDDDAAHDSGYYGLRGLEAYGDKIFNYDTASYYENYEWDIYELAAEDYVQLMGSPNAKLTQEFMDVQDLRGTNSYEYEIIEPINAFPQKNIYIPLADEIVGLSDFYYSFIEEESNVQVLESADFNLEIQKESSKRYTITWTNICTDPGALYTLVCYDSNGEFYRVVRTVWGDEEATAMIGKGPTWTSGSYIRWWDDEIYKEDRIFRLYLTWPDGRMQASEPFHVDF